MISRSSLSKKFPANIKSEIGNESENLKGKTVSDIRHVQKSYKKLFIRKM